MRHAGSYLCSASTNYVQHVTHLFSAACAGMLQLRTIAEAAMQELQAKVKEREERINKLTAKLQEHQAAYLEQHARDRAEIEALNNKLFESGAASIAGGDRTWVSACLAVLHQS